MQAAFRAPLRYDDKRDKPNVFAAHNALIYYDSAQPPDPSISEPVLFTIAFES